MKFRRIVAALVRWLRPAPIDYIRSRRDYYAHWARRGYMPVAQPCVAALSPPPPPARR